MNEALKIKEKLQSENMIDEEFEKSGMGRRGVTAPESLW